jgi:hypothetical protein
VLQGIQNDSNDKLVSGKTVNQGRPAAFPVPVLVKSSSIQFVDRANERKSSQAIDELYRNMIIENSPNVAIAGARDPASSAVPVHRLALPFIGVISSTQMNVIPFHRHP